MENTTGLLRHSCHLSQDKNRTKHNLESGKCRVSFHFYPPPALPSNAFASICEQRTCADLGVFPHEQVGDLLTGVGLSADQGHSRPPSPVSRFFRNRNNKQTVKRFLIAIRNSKTVYHRPISHSRMQFMAYLVVFISFAILLGCL